MEENEQIQNAGDQPVVDAAPADPGNVADDAAVNNDAPDAAGSPQPDSRDAELTELKKNNRALNRAVVEARRGNRNQDQGAKYDAETLNTPEGQYAVSLEVADGRLRGGLEKILNLYPEIKEEDKARIRSNPWAFAGRDAWMAGDHQQALDEIELNLVDRVDDLASPSTSQTPQGNPRAQAANVQGNPAPEPVNPDGGATGSEEDVNLWTMPMDKLDKLANEQFKKLSQTR